MRSYGATSTKIEIGQMPSSDSSGAERLETKEASILIKQETSSAEFKGKSKLWPSHLQFLDMALYCFHSKVVLRLPGSLAE